MRARRWILALLGIAVSGTTEAATSSSFEVSASIVPGCLVQSGTQVFGVLDFGTHSALARGAVSASLGGTGVRLRCTPGVLLSMSLDAGQHAVAGVRHLQRVGAGQRLAYQLYRDAGLSQVVGVGQALSLIYSDPNAIALPLYGRLQLPGDLPAGQYSDAVQVTLTW